MGNQLGQLLRDKKYVTDVQLEAALQQQRRSLSKLGLILVKNGFKRRSYMSVVPIRRLEDFGVG